MSMHTLFLIQKVISMPSLHFTSMWKVNDDQSGIRVCHVRGRFLNKDIKWKPQKKNIYFSQTHLGVNIKWFGRLFVKGRGKKRNTSDIIRLNVNPYAIGTRVAESVPMVFTSAAARAIQVQYTIHYTDQK